MKLMALILALFAPLVAAGPHGGGGGGHAGGGGGGHIASPSMSRAAPHFAPHPAGGGAEHVHQFIQHANAQPMRPAAGRAPSFEHNAQIAHHTNQAWHHLHPQSNQYFNGQFFNQHNYHPNYYHAGTNWWRGSNWGNVNSWVGGGWAYPIYYDDSGYPVSINTENDYGPPYGGYGPDEEQPPLAGEEPAPPGPPTGDWLPLGVFIAAKSEEQAPYSSMYVQLALNRSGIISGTYYNAATNIPREIVGQIDKSRQEAVWLLADNSASPLMTTGLYNLTQGLVPVQVHFPDGTSQPWVLVRLQQPPQPQ